MHIKSQGLRSTGEIYVHEFGMTCSTDYTKCQWLKKLAGGLYSGIISIIFGLTALYYGAWSIYVPWITVGAINIAYGFWEMKYGSKERWKIYLISLISMVLFWIIYLII